MIRRWLGAAGLLFVGAVIAACQGEEAPSAAETPTTVITPAQVEITPVIVSSDLAVGSNRFSVGLLTQDNREVVGAQVHLGFYKLSAGEATLKAEADAQSIRVEKSYTETRPDGTLAKRKLGETGVYVANVDFDQAGDWAVEVTAIVDGQSFPPLAVQFTVAEESLSPAVGEPAPRSRQLTLADVDDIAEIDTSETPDPHMHDMTIAEAVVTGSPVVIVFATPQFCLSRICGPTKEIVDELYEKYKDQVIFIHVEPYLLKEARAGSGLTPVPVTAEWGMQTEPWVFIVDGQGKVAAKFEAVVAQEEIEKALQPLLAAGSEG